MFFNDTLDYNIRYGRSTANDDEVVMVVMCVCLNKMIE